MSPPMYRLWIVTKERYKLVHEARVAAHGQVRTLLGAKFGLPILLSNHRMTPETTPAEAQGWHPDGGSQYTEELHYLQVFYYPQLTTVEMGPTELCPLRLPARGPPEGPARTVRRSWLQNLNPAGLRRGHTWSRRSGPQRGSRRRTRPSSRPVRRAASTSPTTPSSTSGPSRGP